MSFKKYNYSEVIKIYNNNKECDTFKKLSELTNIPNYALQHYFTINNIKIRTRKRYRIYNIDETYFEKIDTSEKAYFLGLLMADGWVGKNVVAISLQEKDKEILEKFIFYIKYKKSLSFKKKQKDTWQNQYTLHLNSKKITKDLYNLGIVPNKTEKATFPTKEQVPEYLQSHFIRGYFDGDGCIGIYSKKNNINYSFSIIGTNNIIENIKQILIKNCDLNTNKTSNKYGISIINYGAKKDLIKIREYLYKDSKDLFLTRKKEKFDKI
jgi:intein-encoded DNA endonuclease-like protein